MIQTLIHLALILDFSGSMEQKVMDQSKHNVLVEKISALSKSYPGDSNIIVIYFGSEQKNTCSHIQTQRLKMRDLASWIQRKKPKAFAQTPLAQSFVKLGNLNEKYNIKNVLVITDGTDSCSRNPCRSFKELARKYAKRNKKLDIDLIGYDLDKRKYELNCYVKNLKSISYNYHPAQNDAQFSKILKNIDDKIKKKQRLESSDLSSLGGYRQGSDKLFPQAPSLAKGSSYQRFKNKNAQKKKSEKINSRKTPLASIKILGAPDSTEFELRTSSLLTGHKPKAKAYKKWQGSFTFNVPSGKYILSLSQKSFQTLNQKGLLKLKNQKVDLRSGQLTELLFSSFLKKDSAFIRLSSVTYPLRLEKVQISIDDGLVNFNSLEPRKSPPVSKKEVKTKRVFTIKKAQTLEVPPGDWRLSITTPWWLDGPLDQEFEIQSTEKKWIQVQNLVDSKTRVLVPPSPKQRSALLLTGSNGEEVKILVPKKSKSLLIPKNWSHFWIRE